MKHARSLALHTVVGFLTLSIPVLAGADQAKGIAALGAVAAVESMACWTATLAEEHNETKAATRKDYARRGALVGVSLSYAHETYESDVEPSGTNLSVKDSLGMRGRAGYRCHRYASADLQIEWLDEFKGKLFEDGMGHVADFDVEPIVATANARGYVPLFGDRVQPFVLFGAGLASVKTVLRDVQGAGGRKTDRTTEFALRAGGGIDFYVTPNIVLTLESDYMQAFDDLKDFDYVSIGLGAQYRY